MLAGNQLCSGWGRIGGSLSLHLAYMQLWFNYLVRWREKFHTLFVQDRESSVLKSSLRIQSWPRGTKKFLLPTNCFTLTFNSVGGTTVIKFQGCTFNTLPGQSFFPSMCGLDQVSYNYWATYIIIISAVAPPQSGHLYTEFWIDLEFGDFNLLLADLLK